MAHGRDMKRRDWADARAKIARERYCRRCGRPPPLEAAHTLGRRYDKPKPGRKTTWVNPLDVIALCSECHRRYDAHEFGILTILTRAELDRATALDRGYAVRRLRGPRSMGVGG